MATLGGPARTRMRFCATRSVLDLSAANSRESRISVPRDNRQYSYLYPLRLVQANVLDFGQGEIVRRFEFFSIQDDDIFKLSPIDESNVHTLIAHPRLWKFAEQF